MSLGTVVRAALLTTWVLASSPAWAAADAAPAKPPAADQAKAARGTPGALLDRFEHVVGELSKLTDAQKTKIAALMEKARADAKDETSAKSPKFEEIFKQLRKDLAGVLTAPQQLELRDKMQPGPGARIDEIKRQLHEPKFKLTDEQKAKVDEVLDDTKKKLEDLKADAQKGGKDIAARAGVILKDMHDRLAPILSPDQQKQISPGSAPPQNGKGEEGEKK